MKNSLIVLLIAVMFVIVGLVVFMPQPVEAASTRGQLQTFTDRSSGLIPNGDYNLVRFHDFDGDGNLDFAVGGEDYGGNADHEGLYAFRGDGAGGWTNASTGLPITNAWGGIGMGDCDGDGNVEMYAGDEGWGTDSNSGMGAWEYSGGTWSSITSPVTSGTVNDVLVKDFMLDDGNLDLVVTSSRDNTFGIKAFYGDGQTSLTWTERSSGLPTSGEYAACNLSDINEDGLIDIIAVGYGAGGLHIYNQTQSGWQTQTGLPSSMTSGAMIGMTAGDVNNDGNIDIITGGRGSGLKMALGDGAFGWSECTNFPSGFTGTGSWNQMDLADIDQDGDLDLIVSEEGDGLALLLGNGSQNPTGTTFTWTEATGLGLPTNGIYYGAAFGDFTNDGVPDIGAARWGNGGMEAYETNLVMPPNPVANAGPNQSVTLGSIVTLNGSLSYDNQDAPGGDPTGTLLSGYDWNVTSVPVGSLITDLSFTPGDDEVEVTFTPDMPGNYTITLSVTDGDARTSPDDEVTINVTVPVTNSAPTVEAGPAQYVFVDTLVELNGTVTDDNDALAAMNIMWTQDATNPEVVTLSDATDVNTSFTPTTLGIYNFTLNATDLGGLWTTDTVMVTVNATPATNQLPTAHAGDDQTVPANETVTLNGSGSSDPDGTISVYNWTQVGGTTITLSDEAVVMPTFMPTIPGIYTFNLSVQDNNGSWSSGPDQVEITVEENITVDPNEKPTASAGLDIAGLTDELVTLNGSGSEDTDGSIVTWEWTQTAGPAVTLTDSNSSAPTFTPTEAGTYNFSLRVMDDNGSWSEVSNVSVVITEAASGTNVKPTASVATPDPGEVDVEVEFDASASSDPDGSIVSWEWTQTAGPTVTLGDSNSSSPTFTPTEAGTYEFELRVLDDNGTWSDAVTVTVTITDGGSGTTNNPPTVDIVEMDDYWTESSVYITWSASDPDGDDITFTVEIYDDDDDLVETLLTDSSSTSTTWTSGTATGTYYVKVTATDDGTPPQSAEDTETFTVSEPITGGGNGLAGLGTCCVLICIVLLPILVIIFIILIIVLMIKKGKDKKAAEQAYDGETDTAPVPDPVAPEQAPPATTGEAAYVEQPEAATGEAYIEQPEVATGEVPATEPEAGLDEQTVEMEPEEAEAAGDEQVVELDAAEEGETVELEAADEEAVELGEVEGDEEELDLDLGDEEEIEIETMEPEG